MGSISSRIRLTVATIRSIYAAYSELSKRLALSPGIPVRDPSTPYWTIPPSGIACHGSKVEAELPSYADIVIIGSGITGTSFARTLFTDGLTKTSTPKVVMLEARDTCSGATARSAKSP